METQLHGLNKYPEFKTDVDLISTNVWNDIHKRAEDIESDMPYKFQFLLEEVIKELKKYI